MRKLMTVVGAVGCVMQAGAALASESQNHTEANAQYLESVLRTEAAQQGIELPDFSTLTAQGIEYDAATGVTQEKTVPLNQALRQVASLLGSANLADPATTDASGLPTLGVGNNVHGYASLRLFQCNAKGYYEGWRTSQEVPAVGFVPNPLFPVVPVAGATVWGGPGFHMQGGGWLIGLHGFVGAPVDGNVNTGGSTAGVPVSPFLAVGLNNSIDAAGVGKIYTSSTPIKIFGICLGSVDLGGITMNGMLAVNGEVIPENPAGL